MRQGSPTRLERKRSMGTPSGSKNCNILTDRLDFLASQFERPVYDTSNLEADARDDNPNREWQAEKKLKSVELAEFHKAKSGAKLDRKAGKLERMVVKPLPVGPNLEKRKLPGFVKLKSKEIYSAPPEADAASEEREAKRPHSVGGSTALAAATSEKAASDAQNAAPSARAFASAPFAASPDTTHATSPVGGSGLVAYDSDESDSGDEQ